MHDQVRRAFVKAALTFPAMAALPSLGWTQAAGEAAKKLMDAAPAHGDRVLGDPKAPVTMIEYASATCPHCAEFHMTIWPAIKKDFVETGKLRFIFREFPLDQLAMGAFMLARCVPDDKYFATIDMMFRQQQRWTKNEPKKELFRIVQMAGLSAQDADACLQKKELVKSILETREKAAKEFGVKGTPAFFVNGALLDGHKDPSAIRKAIEDALAAAPPQ